MTDLVHIEDRADGVRRVVLNRPEKRNAMSVAMLEKLDEALRDDCRVLVLAATGPAFCAGLDLKESADAETAERSASLLAAVYRRLIEAPMMTIAVAQGAVRGGGVGLLLAADLTVANEEVSIAFPELRRGIVPALVAALLRRRVGDGTARSMLLTGRPMPASQAAHLGLIHDVDRDLSAAETRVVDAALAAAPSATKLTKTLLGRLGSDLDEAFGAAHAAHVASRLSGEFQEGTAAFAEKRPPVWAKSDPDASAAVRIG
jgi:enoyl-CoA hydratase/carnithine racemase